MQQFFTPFLDLVVKNQGWKAAKPQTVRAAGLCPVQSVLSHRRSECVGKVIITSQAKIFFALRTSHTSRLGLLPRFLQVWGDKIQGHSRALLFQGPHTDTKT